MAQFGTNDLVMTADRPFTWVFTHDVDEVPVDWTDLEVHLQMRDYRGNLLIELTAFLLEVDPLTPNDLVLDIDASFTRHLAKEGVWDLLAFDPDDETVGFRTPMPPGRIIVLQGVTLRV